MIKWYENLAKELNIPMFMIDIPFNPDYEVSDAETEYIKAQFWDVIHGLEAYTGKKWSDEALQRGYGFLRDAQAAHGSRQPPRQNMFRPRSMALIC